MGGEGRTGAVIRADPAGHHTRCPPSGVAVCRPRVATVDGGRVPVSGGVPDPVSGREPAGGGPHPESAGGRLRRLAIAGVAGPDGVGTNAGTAVGLGVGLHRTDPGRAPAGREAQPTTRRRPDARTGGPRAGDPAEIEHQIGRLRRLLDGLDPQTTEPEDIIELGRLLYGLYAVLRLHNAQEEEGAFSLVPDGAAAPTT